LIQRRKACASEPPRSLRRMLRVMRREPRQRGTTGAEARCILNALSRPLKGRSSTIAPAYRRWSEGVRHTTVRPHRFAPGGSRLRRNRQTAAVNGFEYGTPRARSAAPPHCRFRDRLRRGVAQDFGAVGSATMTRDAVCIRHFGEGANRDPGSPPRLFRRARSRTVAAGRWDRLEKPGLARFVPPSGSQYRALPGRRREYDSAGMICLTSSVSPRRFRPAEARMMAS
jgi:hypothetical protein